MKDLFSGWQHVVGLSPDFSLPFAIAGSILTVILLIISGLLSGAEVAFFSLTPNDIHKFKQKEGKTAPLVLRLLKTPDYLLSTILLCDSVANIAMIILSSALFTTTFAFESEVVKFLIEIVLISFLLLLVGEITPKILAAYNAPRFAAVMSYPLYFVMKVVKPFSFLLVKVTSTVNRRIAKAKKNDNLSINDLSNALDVTHTESAEDRKILKGIVNYGNTDVREIMTPRIDVVAVEDTTDFEDLLEYIVQWEYSRLPVYKDNLDDIQGVLYIKDLLKHLDEKSGFLWQSLVRAAFFVPENKKINDLLEEFQKDKNHLAVVVDEYGGTLGIVTLEDILEEVVGEISDESDVEERLYQHQSDGTYLFEGKTLLNDFCKVMEIEDDYFDEIRGEAETLAGLLLELKGDFLKKSEEVTCKKFTFTVANFEKHRIQKIRVVDNHSEDA